MMRKARRAKAESGFAVGNLVTRRGTCGTMTLSDTSVRPDVAQNASPTAAEDRGEDEAAERGQYIPIRKSDILDALIEHGGLTDAADHDKFRRFWRQLGSIYHYMYFDELEKLRDDYYYFNPELEESSHIDAEALEHLHREFDATLGDALKDANFIEVPHPDIVLAHAQRHTLQVPIETPTDDYREIRFFHRGHHKEMVEVTRWFGLSRRMVEVSVYDHVIVMVMMKRKNELTKRQLKRIGKTKLRPGSILIKYFRNIARADLNMLFPEVRVVMSAFDKVTLGLPALVGGIPIILNLVPTITVLFLLIGFYLGLTGEVENDAVKKAFAALSGLAALGGFILRQWLRYQAQSLKYQKAISDNVYFRNINNNTGIFDYIIGMAEEQESKEVFLAYYFLLTARAPLAQSDLEDRIERWLQEKFRLDVSFGVDNALRMLGDLGLVKREGERLSVPSLHEAIIVLDQHWAKFFPVSNANV
jgi:hypothetical protein